MKIVQYYNWYITDKVQLKKSFKYSDDVESQIRWFFIISWQAFKLLLPLSSVKSRMSHGRVTSLQSFFDRGLSGMENNFAKLFYLNKVFEYFKY